jgi:hypothetical protein
VRDRDALFCPECGKALSEKPAEPKADDSVDSVSFATAAADSETPDAVRDAAVDEPSSAAPPATAASSTAKENPKDEDSVPPAHRRGEKTRERLHRASDIARGVGRGVIEEPAKRVEKIRHASNVVIEEASYDPSLRFVLVALGLFVVFVILLVLSKVMG